MPPKAASELTQVESLFLAIAARLFTAEITFSAHPPDDGQQAYLVRKVKDEIILVGNQFKKFMGDPSKHTKKPCMHPIIQIMSKSGSNYLQGLQNHRQCDKGKRHALPPAGASDPHGTPPTQLPSPLRHMISETQGDILLCSPRRAHPLRPSPMSLKTARCLHDCRYGQHSQCTGRASDSSLPCVQVDDVSPPPPAQPRRLDVKPLIATGDSCKINNAEYTSHLQMCVLCGEEEAMYPCSVWAQPVIRVMKLRNLDLRPGVEASYGPLAVGTSSIYPGEELESRIDSLEAKMDHAILVLNALAIPFQDISNPHHLVDHLPPAITPYLHLELPLHPWGFLIRHPNPNHVPAPGQSAQYIAGEVALCPLHTSKEEALEARAAHLLSRNEIYICLIIDVAPHLTHRTHV
ncbi:hypothetical protein EI94DRAFT_1701871 [Lactarius quietus]|nr:hypothetical protein EI94DRAFT_1701871 [Lactarius quietus]